ncbi:MAG: hypothetical protein JOZ01_03935, partial [Candidatus Eremiobacteraeota bacterium]|nr:hypothetical protein [Candidatus Eremiobacteraeota bacterium]
MRKVTRRRFVATGAAGTVLLVLAGCTRSIVRESRDESGYRFRVLKAADRELLAAVATAMLAGALPVEGTARRTALVQTVEGIDAAVSGLPPSVVDEVRQLFGLLEFPLTRAIFAGIWSGWTEADTRA